MDDFQEDNIRPPDEVIRERLIENTVSDYEKQIHEAIQLSMEELKQQQLIQDNYEKDLVIQYLNECKKRRELFEEFLLNLNKLIKYDKEIKEIYDIISPIIELYCSQHIEVVNLDKITCDKIFNVLSKTRINKQTFEIIKSIILHET